jgi:hypothetical protein
VATRYAIEHAAPQNPITPAQNSVAWSSVGRVHSSNQIQNLRRRSVCKFRPVVRLPVSVTSTIIHCVGRNLRQAKIVLECGDMPPFCVTWQPLASATADGLQVHGKIFFVNYSPFHKAIGRYAP